MGRYRIPPWRVALIVLLLTNFVWPFSYVPNPLGLYYMFAGGYEYYPTTPFVNGFALLRIPYPSSAIEEPLKKALGQTGLDPLDPVHPLTGYRIVRVTQMSRSNRGVVATVEMQYRDAEARLYNIAVYGCGCGAGRWCYENVGGATAEHRELPYFPFADAASPIALGIPQLLPMRENAQLQRNFPYTDEMDERWSGSRYNAEREMPALRTSPARPRECA